MGGGEDEPFNIVEQSRFEVRLHMGSCECGAFSFVVSFSRIVDGVVVEDGESDGGMGMMGDSLQAVVGCATCIEFFEAVGDVFEGVVVALRFAMTGGGVVKKGIG